RAPARRSPIGRLPRRRPGRRRPPGPAPGGASHEGSVCSSSCPRVPTYPLERHREPQPAVTLLTGDRLRCAPPRRELESLLRPAVGTCAMRIGRELCGAEPLEELPHAVEHERWNEYKMCDGDKHCQESHAPPLAESLQRPPRALLAIELPDRHGAACGPAMVAAEAERLNASVMRPHGHLYRTP